MKKILQVKTRYDMKFFDCKPTKEEKITPTNLTKGQTVNLKPAIHQVWMLTKGELTLSLPRREQYPLTKGQVFFLPQGDLCTATATMHSHLICFQIPDIYSLLREFYPEGLAYESEEKSPLFYPLHGSPLLGEYSRHLRVLLKTAPFSPLFYRLQIYQLLLFFKELYPTHEVAALFSPIIPAVNPFEQRVWKNYQHARNLAELATACHMSVRTFERQFKKIFGIPPGQWLIQRRIEKVYYEIIKNEEPLTIVADKCGFHSPAQFSDFCKKYLGKAPSKLRKGNTR